MKLIVSDCWIKFCDNPWLPKEVFRGGDEKIFVYKFKKHIIINDNLKCLLPLFEVFGGFRSSYIGSLAVKISLDNKNIKIKEQKI